MILEAQSLKEIELKKLQKIVNSLSESLTLAVIQVGNDPASNVYIKAKEKMCKDIGYNFRHIKLPETSTEKEILAVINKLNNNPHITSLLVQMPLPDHLSAKTVQNAIHPLKDVDGLNEINIGRLTYTDKYLIPCTASGIITLLEHYKIELESKHVVIIGRSDLVGKPLINLFLRKNATVTICHSHTKNLKSLTQIADLIITATGVPKLLTQDFVTKNSVVIDVGINRTTEGLSGDADFENLKTKVRAITPVPGGVGQMTVLELAKNVLKSYNLQKSEHNKNN